MAQDAVVAVLVAAAAGWVLWKLVLPRAVTDRLRRGVGKEGSAERSACGACGGCGGSGGRLVKARHGGCG